MFSLESKSKGVARSILDGEISVRKGWMWAAFCGGACYEVDVLSWDSCCVMR